MKSQNQFSDELKYILFVYHISDSKDIKGYTYASEEDIKELGIEWYENKDSLISRPKEVKNYLIVAINVYDERLPKKFLNMKRDLELTKLLK